MTAEMAAVPMMKMRCPVMADMAMMHRMMVMTVKIVAMKIVAMKIVMVVEMTKKSMTETEMTAKAARQGVCCREGNSEQTKSGPDW